ncbi:MAG: hypothetical protein F6K38_27280, partial [Moorea sp. SIO3B2]|nr:hypothetical protein [Moorena sp. SIO3B2]
ESGIGNRESGIGNRESGAVRPVANLILNAESAPREWEKIIQALSYFSLFPSRSVAHGLSPCFLDRNAIYSVYCLYQVHLSTSKSPFLRGI